MGDFVFYEFGDEIVTVDIDDIPSNTVVAGFISVDKLPDVAEKFGFCQHTVMMCGTDKQYFRSDIQIYDDYVFGVLKLIDLGSVGFYIKSNLFVVVDMGGNSSTVRDMFLSSLGRYSLDTICIEKLVIAFFESVVSDDSKHIEDMQKQINSMEEIVEKDRVKKDFNLRLLDVKKRLLDMRNYYEQLIDISQALEDNEAELFEKDNEKYFKVFEKKAVRLKECVDVLRDNVVHLKDAYQSYLELKLNETMKIFTVFTVIFSPLTLITGWYGMNFANMPELSWKYGYAFVIVLAVSVFLVLVIIFKKKKWI